MKIVSLTHGVDPVTGNPWVMCPLCFDVFDVVSARDGGMLSTVDNGTRMSDVCVNCAAREVYQFAIRMGA